VTVAGVASSCPLTQTAAAPTTPLTTSSAVRPAASRGRKSVRHHYGTANRGTVSAPILVM
jgi:hypothetical protein